MHRKVQVPLLNPSVHSPLGPDERIAVVSGYAVKGFPVGDVRCASGAWCGMSALCPSTEPLSLTVLNVRDDAKLEQRLTRTSRRPPQHVSDAHGLHGEKENRDVWVEWRSDATFSLSCHISSPTSSSRLMGDLYRPGRIEAKPAGGEQQLDDAVSKNILAQLKRDPPPPARGVKDVRTDALRSLPFFSLLNVAAGQGRRRNRPRDVHGKAAGHDREGAKRQGGDDAARAGRERGAQGQGGR